MSATHLGGSYDGQLIMECKFFIDIYLAVTLHVDAWIMVMVGFPILFD